MTAVTYIPKSQYIKGKQCAKALWYHHHRKDLRITTDDTVEARFEAGREVGELARSLYPDGQLVDCKPWEIERSVNLTQELINKGARIIYEAATLAPDGAYARADILVKTDGGTWNLIEVKGSASLKEYHLDDAAVQYYAFTQSGYKIGRCFILLINNQYMKQGELELAELFREEDVTDVVLAQQPAIPGLVASLTILSSQTQEPSVGIGLQCSSPFECDYQHHCWKDVPPYSVFDVLQKKKAFELVAATGSYLAKDIPESHIPKGAKGIDLRCHLEGATHADKARLRAFLKPLQYPIYYLDFESINPAIPLFDGSRPFQHVAFQFSLHVEHAADRLESGGYLHWQQTDPREEFVEQLLKQCGTHGPIIVYNKTFESGCITDLADTFPKHAAALLALNDRMVDLLVPFKQRWLYHPGQNGSASIKSVLPAFTGKSYDELDIAEGSAASNQYLAFMRDKLPGEEKEKLYNDLIAYCELDTHAMVDLMRVVRSIIT